MNTKISKRLLKRSAIFMSVVICISTISIGSFKASAEAPVASRKIAVTEMTGTTDQTDFLNTIKCSASATDKYYQFVTDVPVNGVIKPMVKFLPSTNAISKNIASYNLNLEHPTNPKSYPISSIEADFAAVPTTTLGFTGLGVYWGTKTDTTTSTTTYVGADVITVLGSSNSGSGIQFKKRTSTLDASGNLNCAVYPSTDQADTTRITFETIANGVSDADVKAKLKTINSSTVDANALTWYHVKAYFDANGNCMLAVSGTIHFLDGSTVDFKCKDIKVYDATVYDTKNMGVRYNGYSTTQSGKRLAYLGDMAVNYDVSSYYAEVNKEIKNNFIVANPIVNDIKDGNYNTTKKIVEGIKAETAANISASLTALDSSYSLLDDTVKAELVTDGYYDADLVEALKIRTKVFTDGIFEYNSKYSKYFTDENGFIIGGYVAGALPSEYKLKYKIPGMNGGMNLARDYTNNENVITDVNNMYRDYNDDANGKGVIILPAAKFDGVDGLYAMQWTIPTTYVTSGSTYRNFIDSKLEGFRYGDMRYTVDSGTKTFTSTTFGSKTVSFSVIGDTETGAYAQNIKFYDADNKEYTVSNSVKIFEPETSENNLVFGGVAANVQELIIKYNKINVNLENDVSYSGRSYTDESGNHHFAWAGNAFSFKFDGSSANAVISTEKTSGIATEALKQDTVYTTATVACDVLVDDVKVGSFSANENKSNITVNLCSGLTPGVTHTVKVVKHGGAMYGNFILNKINVSSDTTTVSKPASSDRVIEYIGDSITEGFGLIAHTNTFSQPNGCNSSLTSAGMAATLFGADTSIIAASGVGMVNGFINPTMPEIYDYVNYFEGYSYNEGDGTYSWSSDNLAKWNNQSSNYQEPDVIVINLGTNDSSCSVTDSQFTEATKTFITKIRTANPDVPILFAYGIMGNAMSDSIQAAIDSLTSDGMTGLHFCELDGATSHNATAHPTLDSNIDTADKLIMAISEITGWDSGYGALTEYYELFNREIVFGDYNNAVAMHNLYTGMSQTDKDKITAISSQDIENVYQAAVTANTTANSYISGNIVVKSGASARIKDTDSGIRFETKIGNSVSKSDMETQIRTYLGNKENSVLNNCKISYGGIIAPTLYVKKLNELGFAFNFDGLNKLAQRNPGITIYKDISAEKWTDDSFVSALININEQNYSKEFSFLAYVKVEYRGSVSYFYSNYSAENNSRSIANIADLALKDDKANFTEAQKAILQKFANALN